MATSNMERPTRMTDEQRELHQRIIANPTTVTRAERNEIYRHPTPEEEDRLCQEKIGLTMSELKEKAITNSDTLTETECDLIVYGASHERGNPDSRANSFWFINLPPDDVKLVQKARGLLASEYENEVFKRAYKRFKDFDSVRRERIAQKKQELQQASLKAARPQWLHDVYDARLPQWGFVIFRTAFGEGFDAKWGGFRFTYDKTMITVLNKCWGRAASLCSSHRSIFITDTSLDGANAGLLRQRFKIMKEQNQIPTGIATDCFLIVDEVVLNDRVISSKIIYTPKNPGDQDPWQSTLSLRASNPDHDASAPILSEGDLAGYEGEITIPLPRVFDWLYYCFLAKSEDWETRYKATRKGPAEFLVRISHIQTNSTAFLKLRWIFRAL